MSEWKKIWNKREIIQKVDQNTEQTLLELKRLNGFESVGYELDFNSYLQRYHITRRELEYSQYGERKIKSVFEFGNAGILE